LVKHYKYGQLQERFFGATFKTKINSGKRKEKGELITGRIFLITGRILCTVGDRSLKNVKLQNAKCKIVRGLTF